MSLNAGSDGKALVLAATDIVELIGQSVALKRRGKEFVGLCPFHTEKTPSFHVSPTKQFYHCYGCKEHGNAIDFVIKRDRVTFVEALKILAERAGVELPRMGGAGDKQRASERQLMFEAQSAACAAFEGWLADERTGRAAREYLSKRGFSPEIVKSFRIGVALDSWDALLQSPGMRKFPPGLLATAGLVKPRNTGEGFYDTFRNRLMFPIFEEAQARIIAFGGRVMPGSEDPAKYLNSPETPLFSKSRCVYGLNFARQRMIETGTAVVVEGYTDVMMAHQHGVTNVVSILGTAMTEHHVNLLKRFANKIVLLFDADEAGDIAVDRAVELFLTKDVEIAIASMPEGVDPDEFLMEHGAEGFEKVVGEAKEVLAFKWSQMVKRYNASGDVTSQQKAVGAYLELLANARGSGPVDSMRWGAALARMSRLTEIPVDELHRRFRPKSAGSESRRTEGSPGSQGSTDTGDVRKLPLARELAEREIMGILLREPARWHRVQLVVHPEDFGEVNRRKLAEVYWQHQQDEGEPVFSEFLGVLTDAGAKAAAVELMELAERIEDGKVEERLQGALNYLEEERRRREQEKQLANVRRISVEGGGDITATFAEFVKNNQKADLRRLGPVRRSKSGS
jgi:DNA primase